MSGVKLVGSCSRIAWLVLRRSVLSRNRQQQTEETNQECYFPDVLHFHCSLLGPENSCCHPEKSTGGRTRNRRYLAARIIEAQSADFSVLELEKRRARNHEPLTAFTHV